MNWLLLGFFMVIIIFMAFIPYSHGGLPSLSHFTAVLRSVFACKQSRTDPSATS